MLWLNSPSIPYVASATWGKSWVRQKLFWLCLCWVPWVLLMGCGQPGDRPELRVVISTLATSGSGHDVVRGAQLALDEAGGKAGGHPIALEIYDTLELTAEQPLSVRLEKAIAEQAVADPQVIAYLGPMASHQAKVSMPILNRASLPQVSSTTTWPGLTRAGFGPGEPGIYFPTGKRHFFRVATPDDVQAAAAARWAKELGYQSIYLLHNSLPYGQGLSGIFEETLRDLGLDIVGHSKLEVASTDREWIISLPQKIAETSPDLVFYAGGSEQGAVNLLRNIRRQNPEISILGTEGIQRNEFIERLGREHAEGILATNVALPIDQAQTETARMFRGRYQERYGEAPQPLAASTYEAMKAILWAIDTAPEPSREEVLAALHSMQEVPGLLGPWHFDERGDTSLQAVAGYRVEEGRWVFQKLLR
ncbi:MAG: branched-chain amino acid ABC transporter substrate-binding protein [Acidobacteriota bacterium]|nr:branched-chain amino acid ABC transporter substrate-binding protein [Acidobacteriota bacterium]